MRQTERGIMSVSTLTDQFHAGHAYPLAWRDRDLMQQVAHAVAAQYLESGYRVVYVSPYTTRLTIRRLLAGNRGLPLTVRTDLGCSELGSAMLQLVGSLLGTEPLAVILEDIMALANRTVVVPSPRYMDALQQLARKHGAVVVGGIRAGHQMDDDVWHELSDMEICECLGHGHQPWFISQEGRKTKIVHREHDNGQTSEVTNFITLSPASTAHDVTIEHIVDPYPWEHDTVRLVEPAPEELKGKKKKKSPPYPRKEDAMCYLVGYGYGHQRQYYKRK